MSGRTGKVKAGKKIEATNVVTGVQVQSAEAQVAMKYFEMANSINSGSVEALEDISADNIVTGFQFIRWDKKPSREDLEKEVTLLRDELSKAIARGEIKDIEEARSIGEAAESVVDEAKKVNPEKGKLLSGLDILNKVLSKASEAALKAGEFGAAIIKLGTVAAGIKKFIEMLF